MRKIATPVAARPLVELVALLGLIALVGPLATPASAALISVDLIPNSGTGELTHDTVTQLQWLDLSETHGQAFVEVASGAYTSLGFRPATLSEVAQLYANAGVFDQSGQDHALNRNAVELLLDLMGCSGFCDDGDAFGQGFAEMEPADPYFAEIAFIQLNPDGVTAAASTVHKADEYLKSIASYEGGTYLVRSVPEPSSWLLQVASLAAMGVLQARTRRV